jgi:hypothetical protein
MYIVFKLAFRTYSEILDMCSKCDKQRKLSELASIIKGVSYPGISYAGENKEKAKTKASSSIEKSQKLRELAKIVKG